MRQWNLHRCSHHADHRYFMRGRDRHGGGNDDGHKLTMALNNNVREESSATQIISHSYSLNMLSIEPEAVRCVHGVSVAQSCGICEFMAGRDRAKPITAEAV